MSDILEANKEFMDKFADAMLNKSKGPEPETCAEQYRVKRLLWASEPDWKTKEAIDYYADTLTLLHDRDDNHCLELKVGGAVARLPIKNPWKYV